MKKYKLILQDRYFGLEVGEVYIGAYRPAKGFMTITKCVRKWPNDWEEVTDEIV